jgi:ZipA-like protein with FtsZ-binding domain
MSTLQLSLIAAGVLFVIGIALYNWIQLRRARRAAAALRRGPTGTAGPTHRGERVEPTIAARESARASAIAENPGRDVDLVDEAFEPPLEVVQSAVVDASSPARIPGMQARASADAAVLASPDPDIEYVVTLQPASPIGAAALAAGLHARPGKPARWLGRAGPGMPWQRLSDDTPGQFTEIAGCLLLADRNGVATRPMLDAFARLVRDIASTLPAAYEAPDAALAAERAEALDRICADLDVQIGLTLLKNGPATIPGTKLRGIAEAAGFHLREGGRFEYVQEETGTVLYSLQNYRSEPFTSETLRVTTTPGAVFVLDVPRVPDPVRTFDQMKLAAKRMVQTLDASLVDDNRRPLDDAALAAIRQQVQAAAGALREVHIEPGSPRALALFGS